MRLRTRLLTSAAVAGSLVVPLVPGAPAGAAPVTPAIDDAIAWLATQQEADGGLEVANFPGFETSDAIYAIAAAGQTTTTWSTSEALAAVEGFTYEELGAPTKDPLDAIDDWVDDVQLVGDTTAKAQQAAKVIVLVAHPLGLDETDFDPSGDTSGAVDLLATLQAGAGDGSYGGLTFGGRAYAAWALGALGETVPPALTSGLIAGQQANGSFDFSGDPTGTGYDNDLTATIITALVTAGTPRTAAVIKKAAVALGMQQEWKGEWAGPFDDGSPNTTGLVMLAAAALGSDPDSPCWRDAGDARLTGVPYGSPSEAMEDRQAAEGHIVGPFDSFGLNTSGTSQAVQGLAAAEGRSRYEPAQACAESTTSANVRIAQAYYVDLLDRVTEPGGAAYWATQFDNGMSPALLAKRFTGTPEYGRIVVERLVQELFGRPATTEELEGASPYIKAGYRLLFRAGILADQEYIDNAGSDEGWAEQVYLDALGRPASSGDVDYVVDQLEAGRDQYDIARALVFSTEGRNAFVRDTYHQLLRREPVSADLAYWSAQLKRGVSPERLVTLIIGSAEYKNSTQA